MKYPCCLLILLLPLFSSSQPAEWKNMSTAQFINGIGEDSNSMWVINYSGVTEFDPVSQNKKYFNTINSPFILLDMKLMTIDAQHNKWFTTYAFHHLYRLNSSGWTVFDTSNSPLTINGISSMTSDDIGNLWLVTGQDIYRYNGNNWTVFDTSITGIDGFPYEIRAISQNRIIVSSQHGFYMYDGFIWSNIDPSVSGFSSSLRQCTEDAAGNLWFVTQGGILKYDWSVFSLIAVPLPDFLVILDIEAGAPGDIWICSSSLYTGVHGSLGKYDGTAWTEFNDLNSSFNETFFLTIFKDSNDHLWFAGYSGELIRYDGNFSSFDIASANMHDMGVKKIVCDPVNGINYIGNTSRNGPPDFYHLAAYDGTNWSQSAPYSVYTSLDFTTDNAGLLYIKDYDSIRVSGSVTAAFPNPNAALSNQISWHASCVSAGALTNIWTDVISNVTVDSLGNTTLHEGVAHWDGTSWTTYSYLNSLLPDLPVSDVKIRSNGEVWVANGFVSFFNGSTWTNFQWPLWGDCKKIVFDNIGNVWTTGSNGSLFKYDGISWTHYPAPLSLGGYVFKDLAVDADNSIWANILHSLVHFDGTTWTIYDGTNSPLTIYIGINTINIDALGHIFIGTEHGIFIYRHGGIILADDPRAFAKNEVATVFPNPATSVIHVTSVNDIHELRLSSLTGQQLYARKIHKGVNSLDIPAGNLLPGIYLLRIFTNEGSEVTNLVVSGQ